MIHYKNYYCKSHEDRDQTTENLFEVTCEDCLDRSGGPKEFDGLTKLHAERMRDDNIIIPENWTFKNKSVARNFQAHVREQLPWYDMATFIVKHYVRAYAPQHGKVYDLGCATGNMELTLRSLIDNRKVNFIPVEDSEEMIEQYQGKIKPMKHDLSEFMPAQFDVAICFLVLMFMKREDRYRLLRRLNDSVNDHGAIIVFEKFQSVNGFAGSVQSKLAMALKLDQGIDADQILNKELSILGSQVPLQENELNGLYYHNIFQIGDFRGILITKKERPVSVVV